ncbi:hypothetical protein [Actinophytocola glycyrrhizae]|uniref:AraC family transcriptional regulator n=1 Tax=Actinophytocola glycyrrhizae TaxID=2044873 RepID=A0ABV9SC37_9PSEU
MSPRGAAALGDGWHVGVVAEVAGDTGVVLDVLGVARGRRFHTGRMAMPSGVAYLVVAPSGAASAGVLLDRYDPAVVVLVGGGGAVVVTHAGAGPVRDAVSAFFSAAGEPAALPGFGGAPSFHVTRGPEAAPPFEPGATARGRPRAWAVVRGDTAHAAQALRYLIPYLPLARL